MIDYADILAPIDARIEYRHQINQTWQAMRRLSQEFHCLVITATQASSAAYTAHTITAKHFTEDKRKRAHVTGTFGLNQTTLEKSQGMYRYEWIFLQKTEHLKPCYTAACLDIVNPCVRSII